jgi:hypothetical protein
MASPSLPASVCSFPRENAKDVSTCEIGPDGSFSFSDVSAQSKLNPSLNRLNWGIIGKMESDITGLILLMEPGQWQSNNNPSEGPSD